MLSEIQEASQGRVRESKIQNTYFEVHLQERGGQMGLLQRYRSKNEEVGNIL